jgi:hypothetical protein
MVFSDAGSEEEAFFCRLDQRSKKRHFAFQMFTQSAITIVLRIRAHLQYPRTVSVLKRHNTIQQHCFPGLDFKKHVKTVCGQHGNSKTVRAQIFSENMGRQLTPALPVG